MANLGSLKVFLSANTTQFNRGLSGGIKRIGAFKAAAVAGAAVAAAAFVKLGVASVKAFSVQEKAQLKLQAVLKATGNAAGFTSKQLFQFADDMSQATGVADEDIISSMGILASFKNIAGDTFKETAELAHDMAAVMGTDVRSAMVQLGKAVNDPKAQMSALSRVGITFNEQQKEQIKTMQESGDMLGAQKVVLKELRSEFGGAAAEMADAEPWKKLQNAFGDLMEEIGRVISIAFDLGGNFDSLTDKLRDMVQWMKENGAGLAVFVRSVWIEIKFAFLQAGTFMTKFWGTVIESAKIVFVFFRDNWKDLWTNMLQVAKNAWQAIKDLFQGKPIDFQKIFTEGMKEITIPALPNLGKVLLDNVERLQEDKRKAQEKLEKDSMKRINDEQKKDIAELANLKEAKTREEAKKEEAAKTKDLITQQFAGAAERGTVAGFSASLGRTVSLEQGKASKETAKNTAKLVEQFDRWLKGQGSFVGGQQLTIGMTTGA